MFATDNLKKAGLCTVAALLAMNITSTQSRLVQGAAAFAATLAALHFGSKI